MQCHIAKDCPKPFLKQFWRRKLEIVKTRSKDVAIVSKVDQPALVEKRFVHVLDADQKDPGKIVQASLELVSKELV